MYRPQVRSVHSPVVLLVLSLALALTFGAWLLASMVMPGAGRSQNDHLQESIFTWSGRIDPKHPLQHKGAERDRVIYIWSD